MNRLIWSFAGVVAAGYVAMTAWALNGGLADPAALMWTLGVVPAVLGAAAIPLWKRPDNPIGRLLLVTALTMFAIPGILEILTVVVHDAQGPQTWMWVPMWANMTLTMVATVLLTTLIVLLPDGRARYRRERRYLSPIWLVVLAPTGSLISSETVLTYPEMFPGVEGVLSPLVVDGLVPYGDAIYQGGQMLAGLVFIGGMTLQILRYRKAPVRERKQVRWVIFATGLAVLIGSTPAVLTAVGIMEPLGHTLAAGFWSGIPIILIVTSVGIAVIEPAWVDVDIVIRRSFVYGALSFVILLLYIGVAAAFGVAAGARMEIEIAVVLTVVVALLFQPARRRLQVVADRWVFGQRPTKYEAVAGLTETIEQSADPSELVPRVVETIQKALDLKWVRATFDDGSETHVGDVDGKAAFTVAIGSEEDEFGAIECGPKTEGTIEDDEVQLVNTIAGQVGLALMNARLAGRIVTAAESERRRIERNIHDGAQQELVALVARLGMARSAASKGELGSDDVAALQKEAQRILFDLRELAQGIHPSVLSDGGILEAVEERCAAMPIDVTLHASESLRAQRYPDDVEGAAYFFITESLANVLKHSEAKSATVTLTPGNGFLVLDVSDDGRGFEPEVTRQAGIDGLRDRFTALGGTVTVSSRLGTGTRIRATLPTQ